MEIKLCDKKDCTGCMACKQKCNHNAIRIVTEDDFQYPVIDKEKCKSCGLCMNTCPVLNLSGRSGNRHESETKCLAAWNKDADIRMKSSSGGTFSVLAEYTLAQGGIVFGAAWDEAMNLQHKGVEDVKDLDALRRSKYVQSDTLNTYNEVIDYLKKGRKVLYCGTPCQIAGLSSFVGNKEYENLLTVDVLCQGVPSPEVFKKYIKEIEEESGMKVMDANFRTKDKGWRCGLLLLLLRARKGDKSRNLKRFLDKNEYYNAFLRGFFHRNSCYDCQFKCNHQGYYSDLTIADFWKIGNKVPLNVKDYTNGISAVIVNTEKGKQYFESCANKIEVIERDWEEFAINGGLRSEVEPKNNDEAFQFLKAHSWRETQKKYFPLPLKRRFYIIAMLLFGEKNIRKFIKL